MGGALVQPVFVAVKGFGRQPDERKFDSGGVRVRTGQNAVQRRGHVVLLFACEVTKRPNSRRRMSCWRDMITYARLRPAAANARDGGGPIGSSRSASAAACICALAPWGRGPRRIVNELDRVRGCLKRPLTRSSSLKGLRRPLPHQGVYARRRRAMGRGHSDDHCACGSFSPAEALAPRPARLASPPRPPSSPPARVSTPRLPARRRPSPARARAAVAPSHEFKERIMAGIHDVSRHPVIDTWSCRPTEAA
jgi:hypothetical protein